MRSVSIIGAGCTRFGERWYDSLRDLVVETGIMALEDASVSGDEIDGLYIGNMSGGRFVEQEHIGALISDCAGLSRLHVPSTRVEAACASGGLALRQAVLAVASGYSDVVIAAGVEKMTDVTGGVAADALAAAADREWECFFGATFPALYAMIARLHMHRFGTTREELAAVAVKNHHNGCANPISQYQMEISVEKVLRSPLVADPLRVLDCSPITDGAAAVVLAPTEVASKYSDAPIKILAAAQASDTLALHDRREITTLDASVYAARKAFDQAGLAPKDIDLAEVHDAFTIGEIVAIEDLGFVEKGEGGRAAEEGLTAIGGKIPINTSGGLKACGHPVGATGIKQAYEMVLQLRGEAGKRQVDGAKVGLTHNVGGCGGTALVHIMSR
ncbi:MAG: thiolase domain-containing protein [Methanothrix sp.]|jgi:acetyl-CoA C-acetyltransferase|uniref:Thiolase n=1 Tax=Methanothrix harundinacea TaxID=301375 RepID=A0A101ILT4_9EURY|nr:MAG: Thiolase [Methanothrix harundinacea]MDD3709752.1 thiolase domain-containing protein [Methanothrix sp.]MDI9398631.1 thiolase domain-containing protein [Euryarchaeota archaeon]KUK97506.1 MAG: Thiolase [Methanothrix harundinacea]MCP1392205.1 thiolase domain-containing protein [Methanothrix harundinacea]